MNEPFKAVNVTDQIWWVGAVDWGLRDFHGYATERGSTYNAYLIVADKVTLVDTVKAPFYSEMMARVRSAIDPSRIDYIISNHSEMDHSGSLPQTIEAVKPDAVFASPKGVEALAAQLHLDKGVTAVKDGESQDLGGVRATFFETRMLHWPDSMFTYLPDRKLLFSQDAFGMHLGSTERFDDELDPAVLDWEAAKYYANILLPFSPLVTKLVQRVQDLGIELELIAPDHGPIWRGQPGRIIELWKNWAKQKPTKKAVIAYDTMWHSTAKMALSIADGIAEGGAVAKVMPLSACHRSDVATELLEAGALLVGSPTINNNIFPTVADLLIYLKGLRPRNLIGAAFGSYGWSGESVHHVADALQAMDVELVAEPLKVKYVPRDAALTECRLLGLKIAERLKDLP